MPIGLLESIIPGLCPLEVMQTPSGRFYIRRKDNSDWYGRCHSRVVARVNFGVNEGLKIEFSVEDYTKPGENLENISIAENSKVLSTIRKYIQKAYPRYQCIS